MHIIVAGSSGLIGSALVTYLKKAGHTVIKLLRGSRKELGETPHCLWWDPEAGQLDPTILEGAEVVINLSGDNIHSSRWTAAKKEKIRKSRIQTTVLLSKALAQLKDPPRLFINASAIGIYGTRGDEVLTETSPPGEGFLATVVQEWEQATDVAKNAGIRVVCLRTGIVLSTEGGALREMLTPFKWGMGGVLGSGNQYMSWIAMDDLLRSILFLIEHSEIHGPVNATAPHPVSNREFTKTLGHLLRRPTIFPLIEPLLLLVFGERAKEILLSSVRAEPKKLLDAGFRFKHSNLKGALTHLLSAS